MKNLLKKLSLAYSCMVGTAAIIVLVAYYVLPILSPEEAVKLLTFLSLAALPAVVLKYCVFAPEISLGGTWVRRMIGLVTGGAWYPGLAVLFGIAQKDAPVWEKVLFVLAGVILSCAFGIPAYISADKTQKTQIEKINEKLQKQADE